MLVDEARLEALFRFGDGRDACFPFGGDEEGGVVELVEKGAMGGIGGEEVGEVETGGFKVEVWVRHRGPVEDGTL